MHVELHVASRHSFGDCHGANVMDPCKKPAQHLQRPLPDAVHVDRQPLQLTHVVGLQIHDSALVPMVASRPLRPAIDLWLGHKTRLLLVERVVLFFIELMLKQCKLTVCTNDSYKNLVLD